MFRCAAFRGVAAAAPVVAGTAQLAQWRRPRKPAHCEIDFTSVAIGAIFAGGVAVAYSVARKDGPRTEATIERRLQKSFTTTAIGRAALADCAVAHTDLVNLSVGEQNIAEADQAVAAHIRDMWAAILSEQFHFPKGFFTEAPDRYQMDAKGNLKKTERKGADKHIGKYKVSIPHLQHNKLAIHWGIDKLAQKFDRNNDGVMDFHEFATMVLFNADFQAEKSGRSKRSKASICQMLYTVLDDDGDGKVTKDEFESFMVMAAKLGIATNSVAVDIPGLWKKFDADGNDILSYKEFLAFARVTLDLAQFPGDFPSA